ncbi:cytochrome P450 [Coprinopsis sp. MPI-PUGE-AT-0042]|nr:cytochrome P450 [Coprinopsis sp. MPI-PUGE-AT-0042]
MLTNVLLGLLAVVVLQICWNKISWRRRSKGFNLPPSRPGYPLIGNMLDMPDTKNGSVVYRQWAKEIGSDIFYVNVAGSPVVVLNTVEMAQEMLTGRSTIYSGRPTSIMMNELMGWSWAISNLPYGREWNDRRKLFHQSTHSPESKVFMRAYSEQEIAVLLSNLYETPEDFRSHIRFMVGAFVINIAFGLRPKSPQDPYIVSAEAAIKTSGEAVIPGAFWVDFFPFLKYVPEWVPGAGFQKKAKEWKAIMEDMRDRPFEDCEKQIAAGVAPPSFASMALDKIDPNGDVDYQRKVVLDTAGITYGSSDTAIASLAMFFIAMMRWPDVQRKAQEHLDRVLEGRLPRALDEHNKRLNYITALVRELVHWASPTPIGVPHKADKDDIFRGYFIPEGTTIIANEGAMLSNEQDYPNPQEFIPERFLDAEGDMSKVVRDPATVVFGFGRRECPGSHIALSTLWLATASILSVYDISKPVDADGNVIEQDFDMSSGVIAHPQPFKATIKPRNKNAEAILRSL